MHLDPAELQRLGDVLRVAMESDSGSAELKLPDGTGLHVVQRPEPGARLRIEPTPAMSDLGMTMWEPADSRPPGYPVDLPFVPNAMVGVAERAGAGAFRSLFYFHVPEPGVIRASLLEQCHTDGWQQADGAPALPPGLPIEIIQLTRGGDSRTVMVAGVPGRAMITLLENAATK